MRTRLSLQVQPKPSWFVRSLTGVGLAGGVVWDEAVSFPPLGIFPEDFIQICPLPFWVACVTPDSVLPTLDRGCGVCVVWYC